jgi:hypothetical protein
LKKYKENFGKEYSFERKRIFSLREKNILFEEKEYSI